MKYWEYKIEYLQYLDGRDLNDHGHDGWELVNIMRETGDRNYVTYRCVFKREIAGPEYMETI